MNLKKPSVAYFILPNENRKTLEEVRNKIYQEKDKFHVIVMTDDDQESIDMFVNDFMHAPADNFVCVTEKQFESYFFNAN